MRLAGCQLPNKEDLVTGIVIREEENNDTDAISLSKSILLKALRASLTSVNRSSD